MHGKAQDDDLIMGLVDKALAKPRDQREEFLREACSGDLDLFEKAWSYVECDDQMQGFLKNPIFRPQTTEHPFLAGDVIEGRFLVSREIAQGGMGVVYEAWDEKLERRIAIKCAKSGFRKRLPPEVRHAREISHPNVCRIFEIHTASTRSGDVDFLTMEYLEGETLADRLQRKPLLREEALTIARQLCAGLGAAHSMSVIHGDLKSSNVILTQTAEGSTRAVITDFGMARARESSQATLQSGPRGGTPDYMAPELWKGEKATPASDVYALGVLLRELSTGTSKSGEAVLLPAPWHAIVAKCTAAGPEARYASGLEVEQAFEPSQAWRWLVIAAATVAISAITALMTYRNAAPAKETVRLAMLPFTVSDELAPVAEGVLREASEDLAKLTGGAQVGYSSIPLTEAIREKVDTPEKAKSVLSATHVVQGTLTNERDQILLHAMVTDTRTGVRVKDWKMTYAPGQVRYVPVALAGMVTGSLHLPAFSVSAIHPAAQADYDAGSKFLARDSTIDAALASFGRAVEVDPDSPLAYAGLAEAEWLKYGTTRSKDWLMRATDSTREAQRRNPDLPRVLYVAGTRDFVSSLYESAVREYQRALELDPNYSDVSRYLGRVYEVSGQTELALGAYNQAIRTDPGNYRTHLFLGRFHNTRGQYAEALPLLQKAAAMSPDDPEAHLQLASVYKSLGRFDDAISELRASLQVAENSWILSQLGETLMYKRRDSEALDYLRRSLVLDSNQLLALLDIVVCYRRLNRPQDGLTAAFAGWKAAEDAKRLNPRSGSTRAYLAYFLAEMGKADQAESELAQALVFSPDSVPVRWTAVLTYESLRKRDASLALLSSASPELLADLNRWPDLGGLQSDPRFIQLLASNHLGVK